MIEVGWNDGEVDGGESPAATSPVVRALIIVFAFGIAADGTIASRMGSSGSASVAVSTALGAPLVLAAGLHLMATRRVRRIPRSLAFLLAYAGWAAASILWAEQEDHVVTRAITNAQLLAFVWLAWQVVRSEHELRAMLGGFVAGCLAVTHSVWRSYHSNVFYTYERYAAEGFDPNDMSVTLALGMPMAAYLAFGGRGRRSLLALCYLPLALGGIALSGSRAGMLTAAMAAACLVIGVARKSVLASGVTLALLAGGMAVVGSVVPRETWSRLFTVSDGPAGASFGGRGELWRAGLELLRRDPLLGIGAGGFPDAMIQAVHVKIVAHSTLLSVLVELGVIGLLLLLTALALLFADAAVAEPNEKALALSLLLTWCVGSASLTWEARKATWFVFLVGAVVGALRPLPRAGDAA